MIPAGYDSAPKRCNGAGRRRATIGGMTDTKTALVTGANKGLGYEIAAGLGALGYRVAVGARDGSRGDAAAKLLRDTGVDAFTVELDVTSDASVAAAAARLDRLDVLVNNAGISGEMAPGWLQDPTTLDLAVVREVVDTNVYGVIRVTNAMLPLLRRSPSPRIVNISSSVGSVTWQADPAVEVGPIMAAYSPTKSYLNAVTVQYARRLEGTGILVNAACPGLVATDFTGFQGRPAREAAAGAIRLATLPDGGPTGTFSNDAGPIPW